MDLFGFGPKFGPYHYARLPNYKRVKLGRLAGPSLNTAKGGKHKPGLDSMH